MISTSSSIWKINLLMFSILILIIQVNFYIQARQAEKLLTDNVREHAVLLGEVIRLNAEGTMASKDIVKEVIKTFLLNSVHFIDYLDATDAFDPDELVALSGELGLAGILLIDPGGKVREGPGNWAGKEFQDEIIADNTLWQRPGHSLFLYRYPRFEGGFIITGMVSKRFNELQEKIGLSELFERIKGVAGVRYVRLESRTAAIPEKVRILETETGKIAETRLLLGEQTLVVGMGCDLYYGRMKDNKSQWMMLSGIIFVAGSLCSYFLYRFQKKHLNLVREMDRNLAREKEDAALGRATAAITHEIRNPLNAISMGLQRLSIETEGMEDEHQALINALLGSVKRADGIIKDLKRFTGPLTPKMTEISLTEVVAAVLNPYMGKLHALGIRLIQPESPNGNRVLADRDYCEILVDNLVKNAVEAQTEGGGFIAICYEKKDRLIDLVITNQGFKGDPAQPEKLLAPYVTTKTRGAGLGLAIVQRIVEAHGGKISICAPDSGKFEVKVSLPALT